MIRFACVTVALMMAASPALAQSAPTATPVAKDNPTSDSSDANRIVCKMDEAIGTRLGGKKVCLTVQEWKERADAHREHTEKIQQQSGFRTGS